MERDLSQNTALCRSGCGFYGSPATDGLCSKCYKDAVKRKQAAPQSNTTSSSSGASSNYVTSSETSNNLSLLPPSACEMNLSTASPTVNSTTTMNILSPAQYCASTIEVKKTETEKGSSKENNADDTKNATVASSVTDEKIVAESGNKNSSSNSETQPQKRKKTRCTKCKISVGVIGFPCRCGGIFCSTHRYANEHSCSFDYKEHGAEEIRKNNPQVVGEKIQKI